MSPLPTIRLVDRHAPLVHAWRHAFEGVEGFEVTQGDYFEHPADAMVSPANSFGIMDGGRDSRRSRPFTRSIKRCVRADHRGT